MTATQLAAEPPRAAGAPASIARASALIAFSACCFGSIPIFTLLGMSAGATLISLLTGRYLFGAALLVVASGGVSRVWGSRERGLPLLIGGGGGQALVAFVTLSSLRYIPAATLAFLFYTYPAWVALFAALRRIERLTPRRLAALGLSLSGIAVMIGAPTAERLHPVGIALALGGAIIYALYVPMIDRFQRGVAPAVSSVFISTGAVVVLVVGGLATGTLHVPTAPMAWAAIAGLAVVSTMLGFIAFLRGLSTLGPVRTAIISTIEPFWTALAGAMLLAQSLTIGTIAGGALIALAVVLLQWRGEPAQSSRAAE